MSELLNLSDLQQRYGIESPILLDGFMIIDSHDMPLELFLNQDYQFRGLIFIFCKCGVLNIRVNHKDYSVLSDATLIILPEMEVSTIDWSQEFRTDIFIMSYDFIEKYTILSEFINNSEVLNALLLYANEKDSTLLIELITLIKKYYTQPKTLLLEQMIQYLVYSLITAVSMSYISLSKKENLQKTRINDITDYFLELVNKYGHTQRNVSFYADHLHLTAQHLSILIKKRTGKSAKSWIGFMVINKAKEYLNTTSLSIKQISDRLEFTDASQFCRYFKRYTSYTPNYYRNL
ncbi:MAG: helix-turn-helix transcriptional regulator [Myroides sp.]|jgi:AraC-like DNA-binding protein|nr:helix-turn-helix transcriptional regulator [Myroides sp.]